MCAKKCHAKPSYQAIGRTSSVTQTTRRNCLPLLTSKAAEFVYPPGKVVYITSGESVVSKGFRCPMPKCNHEEPDMRVVVHVLHALKQGWKTIQVDTVDTDVVTILVGTYHDLALTQLSGDIWVAFGIGKHYRFYSINAICASLGEPRSRELPVFHAFSGCTSRAKARNLCGRLDWPMGRSQKHLSIWHATRSSSCMLTLH